jgi:hypothetical protein
VGWLAAPDANKVQDYTKRREVMHTGHMLDAHGDRAGVICDITPHAIDPAEGLPLSGKATFGSYVTDDHEPVTLGCVEVSPKFLNVSGVAITVALRVRLNAKLPTEGCLFYAGEGWRNHISIKHYRGLTLFEACPGNGGAWEDRVECGAKMDLETGKVLSIVAVMEENGTMALHVDGVRVAHSNGLADVEGFLARRVRRRDGRRRHPSAPRGDRQRAGVEAEVCRPAAAEVESVIVCIVTHVDLLTFSTCYMSSYKDFEKVSLSREPWTYN